MEGVALTDAVRQAKPVAAARIEARKDIGILRVGSVTRETASFKLSDLHPANLATVRSASRGGRRARRSRSAALPRKGSEMRFDIPRSLAVLAVVWVSGSVVVQAPAGRVDIPLNARTKWRSRTGG